MGCNAKAKIFTVRNRLSLAFRRSSFAAPQRDFDVTGDSRAASIRINLVILVFVASAFVILLVLSAAVIVIERHDEVVWVDYD